MPKMHARAGELRALEGASEQFENGFVEPWGAKDPLKTCEDGREFIATFEGRIFFA